MARRTVLIGQFTDSKGAIAKKTITVVVNPKMEELNQVPTIHAEDKVLTVGDAFDSLEGVTAFDEEDGDIALTQENIIANDVDMNHAGTYQVAYQVTDRKGASGIKTITVTVKEKEVQEPQKPKEPSKPQEPQKPDQPAEGTRPNKPDSPAKPIKPSQTPQTGDTSTVGILGGMLADSAGVLFTLRRKRNRTRKNEK